jgi:hypothetical protein
MLCETIREYPDGTPDGGVHDLFGRVAAYLVTRDR